MTVMILFKDVKHCHTPVMLLSHGDNSSTFRDTIPNLLLTFWLHCNNDISPCYGIFFFSCDEFLSQIISAFW